MLLTLTVMVQVATPVAIDPPANLMLVALAASGLLDASVRVPLQVLLVVALAITSPAGSVSV